MPISDQPLFNQFLSEAEIVRGEPVGPFIYFSDGRTANRRQENVPALYLQHPDIDLQLDSVLRVICRELNVSDSPADSRIALALLGLIVETSPVS